ncbi:hypothetical protein [Parapedobacter defluvii]|uniref:hypothetical protein n=1 Tax=Parapedobacter defluvii TaxID=2045106 RepID=UPI001E395F38|nr:hypothetical protein [Parapedobacter defluvii]
MIERRCFAENQYPRFAAAFVAGANANDGKNNDKNKRQFAGSCFKKLSHVTVCHVSKYLVCKNDNSATNMLIKIYLSGGSTENSQFFTDSKGYFAASETCYVCIRLKKTKEMQMKMPVSRDLYEQGLLNEIVVNGGFVGRKPRLSTGYCLAR